MGAVGASSASAAPSPPIVVLAVGSGAGLHRYTPGATTAGPTSLTGEIDQLGVSRDGHQIAYTVGKALMVARSDGSQARKLLTTDKAIQHLSWAPDATRIVFNGAFQGASGDHQITHVATVIVTVKTGATHTIMTDKAAQATWSPDGRWLAFNRTSFNTNAGVGAPLGIAVMHPDGTGMRMVTTRGTDRDPTWSPDSKRVAILDYATGNFDTLVVATGKRRSIARISATEKFGVGDPFWAPTGGQIAVVVSGGEDPQSQPTTRIKIIHADGSGWTWASPRSNQPPFETEILTLYGWIARS
jgi:Tol biopolymer transport system component